MLLKYVPMFSVLQVQGGLILEFLSYETLKNFMRNDFIISQKMLLTSQNSCFAKLAFSMRHQRKEMKFWKVRLSNKKTMMKIRNQEAIINYRF